MPAVIDGQLTQNSDVGNGKIDLSCNTSAKSDNLSFNIPVMPFLMNLKTDINYFRLKKGANGVFDFRTGDPLKGTKVNDC